MKKAFVVATAAAVLAFGSNAFASGPGEKIDHFKGKPAETLPQAVENLSEYNAKLEAILAGEVSDLQLGEVHQLTYTLENALAKINEEVAKLTETLEELHLASERMDRGAVIRHGREYLSVSKQLVK